jgi:hypothetical protein
MMDRPASAGVSSSAALLGVVRFWRSLPILRRRRRPVLVSPPARSDGALSRAALALHRKPRWVQRSAPGTDLLLSIAGSFVWRRTSRHDSGNAAGAVRGLGTVPGG